MGRPRKPTRLLELSGAFAKNPKRRRERENEPTPAGPLGDPPECLGPSERALWTELGGAAWLGASDRPLMELTVRLAAKMRAHRASIGEQALLASNLRALGLTPGTRGA